MTMTLKDALSIYFYPIQHTGEGGGKTASYWLKCSQPSDRPPMVCEFKFVRYGHIKKDFALYVTKFKFDGPLKSEISFLQIVKS